MKEKKAIKYQDIGGQAVMEGVMMQSPANESMAIAVRRPDGKIYVTCEHKEQAAKKHKWMGLPIIRGCVNMVVMLKMGMQTLDKSTQMLGILEEEPTKFEKWLAEKLGANIDKVVMAVAMVLAVVLSLFLFVFLPSTAATLVSHVIDSRILINLAAGVVRIAILVAYIWAVALMPEIKRVFMYHGAEHKTVYCNEAGEELTPENARRHSRLHPRCGTAFLFLVMIISILIGSVADEVIYLLFGIEKLGFLARFGRSLLILPLVTGVSYEVLKGLAHAGDHIIVRALRWPGLMLQHLTTREPDDAMLEVAIASMKAAKAGADRYADELGENVFLYTGEEEAKAEENSGENSEETNEEKEGAQA
ncbi:MAG: DUF1385 domain-containing protein [Clostridia bacterium]|nr:DUF1385 domain-containing protein [Clostridia bacterium]